ncbi:MAG: tetratricopeptide repeat protein, partial [Bacteroidaceae bacterium]|nr:tetratricopeptide repeat protein [Bacteroidaceae bacterium]
DYLDSKDACEKMLQLAKEAQANGDDAKAQKLLAKYEGPLAFIEQTFAISGAADREQIIAIYTKKFDTYKSDIAKLNSSLNLMAQNGCDNDSIYFVYAKAAFDLEPTFTSSIGLAQKAQKDGKAAEALAYYDKALELASDDATRGRICIKVAQALISSGGFSKGEEYIKKAIEFNPSLTGAAYWQMVVSLVKAHDLKGAVAYCDLAGEADITYANRAADMKKRLNEAIAQQATNAKLQAEYNEYMRKKKAEEDFWNQ